jgi:hypothetical protein
MSRSPSSQKKLPPKREQMFVHSPGCAPTDVVRFHASRWDGELIAFRFWYLSQAARVCCYASLTSCETSHNVRRVRSNTAEDLVKRQARQ